MAENSKQEIMLSDLSDIQSEVETLAGKCKDLSVNNEELKKQLNALKKEKLDLQQNISTLQEEIRKYKEKPDLALFSGLGKEEKEELKNNISELISRIDFHLSAERQG